MVAANGQRVAGAVKDPVIKGEDRVAAKDEIEVAKSTREENGTLVVPLLHCRQLG